MSEILLVVEREFITRVRSRSFLISTLLIPVFMIGLFAIPVIVELRGSDSERHVVIVDEGPPEIGDRAVVSLAAEPSGGRGTHFAVEHLRVPLASVRDSLNAAVRDEMIDGYLWIPADVVEQSGITYRARNVTDFRTQERLEAAVSDAVQAARLNEAGLEIGEVSGLLRPVRIATSRITREGEEAGGTEATLALAIGAGFLLYFLIILYGSQVMQSVQEEKTNRISEVLISSIRSSYLMLGKVAGVGSVALLQVVIWGAFAILILSQGGRLAAVLFDADPDVFPTLSFDIDPMVGIPLLLFALLGFFLYAALFAAAGAAAASSEDAQRFTFPLIMPLIVPIMLQQQVIRDPHSTLSTILAWIPLTSPIVMPMRMSATVIPTVEVVGTLLTLGLGVGVFGWVAGKIYRIGILSTGKRPSMRELARWVRAA